MKNLLAVALVLLIFSCTSSKDKKIHRAFYEWGERDFYETNDSIRALDVEKIYYKLFEIDYNEVRGNFPTAKNYISSYNFRNSNMKVIPVVFVKNEVLKKNDHKSLDELADNMVFLINKKMSEVELSYHEIQIDCDWTKSTKENYFYLLKKIKQLSNRDISCTLRLYPYAYPDIMGVPPVDRVMLMCYNLISPLDNPAKNSILDVEELEKYVKGKDKYPVAMDVALPLFSWMQHYQNNRFVGLLDLTEKDIKSIARKRDALWYTIEKDSTINWDTKLAMGDEIKYEMVPKTELDRAIRLLKKHVQLGDEFTVSFFDLNRNIYKKYSNEEISGWYTAFTK